MSLLGSLVSGCVRVQSDINVNLSVPNEDLAFFMHTFKEGIVKGA